ncbi:uncharacterized protein PAC_01439 [Phialocephala subalpina]|uniref:DUF5672 domain-containing protein n=1 Tax=Phialocephala subalpina TaxID=576137 RepID=A0A1L7WFL7_9HELO|nr:uncharacterized protein PAC_01439 [Phialocephala subalpina]
MSPGLAGKKWFYPGLWLLIVIVFLGTELRRHSNIGASITSDSTHDTLDNITSSVADKIKAVPDYYDMLTGANEDAAKKNNTLKTADITTSIKAAIIIETRRSAAVIPLLLHFCSVLGPDWPVVVYTSAENFGSFTTSEALLRYQAGDSVLCSNSARSVEDFFEWDLIGAPISPQWGAGYNGGLSLRRRSTMLRVLQEYDWSKNPHPRPEDQWYFFRFNDLMNKDVEETGDSKIKLPSMEIARTFAVETIDYPSPLGLHQPTRWFPADRRMTSLDEWCPEYKLARTDRINE